MEESGALMVHDCTPKFDKADSSLLNARDFRAIEPSHLDDAARMVREDLYPGGGRLNTPTIL